MDTYRSGESNIRIAIHEPPGPGPFPALLLLHGSGGALSYWLDRFAPMLANSGYAVYSPHYFDQTATLRATPEMILDGRHFPAWLEAARNAVSFIASRPRAAAGRIGAIGISLGAYLAVALAIEDERLRAVVELSGGIPPGWEERLASRMATTANRTPMASTLILHGERDDVVPVSEAHKLEGLLRLHQVRSLMEIFPCETHWFSQVAQLKMLLRCSQFLGANL